MGKMQNNLIAVLQNSGHQITLKNICYPTLDIVKSSQYRKLVFGVYRRLGGIKEEFPLELRHWDIEVDGLAVELDEELHFNRYRALTLQSPVYCNLQFFPLVEYRRYCREHESDCLKAGRYGGKWSNNSCELQFGKASNHGDLNGNGSPRWKQRAFYDLVKDLTPLLLRISVVRISIWDNLKVNDECILVRNVLRRVDYNASRAIWELIEKRSSLRQCV